MTHIAFPTGETGYEAVEIEHVRFGAWILQQRFFWFGLGLFLGVTLGVLFA